MAGKLENLRVERTDGVGSPATGRKWVIQKSTDGADAEKDYAGLSKTAVEALAKEEGLALGEETMEALTALAEALDIELPFEKGEAEEELEAPQAEAAAEEPVAEPTAKADNDEALAERVADILAKRLGIEDEEPAAPVAKSKQASGNEGGEERTIVKGEGLFEDIVFEQ